MDERIPVTIFVSEDERRFIKATAAQRGVTVTDVGRTLFLAWAETRDADELAARIREDYPSDRKAAVGIVGQ